MIFDKLCGLVERFFPQYRRLVENARLFQFPAIPHKVLPKELENVEFLRDHFFLPFRTVAIEDAASVIILHDIEPKAHGLSVLREFIECMPIAGNDDAFNDRNVSLERRKDLHKVIKDKISEDIYVVSYGTVRYLLNVGTSYYIDASLEDICCVTKEKIMFTDLQMRHGPLAQEGMQGVLKNVGTAIEELIYFNRPDRFVLEIENTKPKSKTHSKKIIRSEDRPRYILLKPTEIRKYMGLPETPGLHGPRTPHERRRHYRTLKSDKYVNKKGETIVVSACWIGPSEAKVGTKIYRVRLDI